MNLRSSALLVPLLGVALALFVQFEPAVPGIKKKKRGAGAAATTPQVGGAWSDPRALEEGLRAAIAWSKAATRADFVEEPGVRASDAKTVAAFLLEDLGAVFRKLGAKDAPAAAQMADTLAGHVVAAYDPKGNQIHVLPANAQRAASEAQDDSLNSTEVLRLLLVRMATIALDRQLYPEWKEALEKAEGMDAVHVAGAVLEGHAQYVAERVAQEWTNKEGFDAEAFDNLVKLLTAPHAGAGPFKAEASFAIVKGHAFMKAAARKRRVKKLLTEPPTDRNAIFDPEAFFGRGKAGGAKKLPGKVYAELQALVGGKEEGTPVEAEKAEALLQPLDKPMYAAVLAAWKSGTTWAGNAESAFTEVWLLEFRGPGMAEAYLNLSKAAAEKRGATVEEGAGRDNGLPGFSGTGTTEVEGETQTLQYTAEGRYVLILHTTGDLSEAENREPWDDALEAAAEVLAKAQKTRKNRRDK